MSARVFSVLLSCPILLFAVGCGGSERADTSAAPVSSAPALTTSTDVPSTGSDVATDESTTTAPSDTLAEATTVPDDEAAAERVPGCPELDRLLGAQAVDGSCHFVEPVGSSLELHLSGEGDISQVDGACNKPGAGDPSRAAPLDDAAIEDGEMIGYSGLGSVVVLLDDVGERFTHCRVVVIWTGDIPADAHTLVRSIARAFLLDSYSIAETVATTRVPFPLPPGSPRTEWWTIDGQTFLEDIDADDIPAYCAQLESLGLLGPVDADILALLTETPACIGTADGWLVVVSNGDFVGVAIYPVSLF